MSYTNGLDKPTDYFNTVLWTGDGTSGRTISGVGFQSDFLWIKSRSNATNHSLTDVIRGGNLQLRSNTTDAESQFGSQDITFTSDGFTNAGSTSNNSGFTFVGWNWLASNTTASNTDGSITSTVSANTTSGFSIVSYSGNSTAGATIGHGLGVTPKMLIVRKRNTAENWLVYHESIGNSNILLLNGTEASFSENTWNSTNPTSSVFTVHGDDGANGSGGNYIAYCFAEKKGFSAMGSYQGSGNSDGPMIWTGFKPAWLMVKRSSDGTDRWTILDNKRDSFNVSNTGVYADDSQAENSTTTEQGLDILSNGFKIRNSNTKTNTSGATYIYMAFAENPFTTSTGIPCTAR